MRSYLSIALLGILIVAVLCAGCGSKIPSIGGKNATSTATPTPTPVPTPAFGNLSITSTPYGASVYIEDQFRGIAPMTINDIPNGRYNLTVKLERYSTYKTTADIRGGQTTTINAGLSVAQPRITMKVTNTTLQRIPPCVWSFVGTVTNEGDAKLSEMTLKLEMNPQRSEFEKIVQESKFGDLSPGLTKPFGFQVTVLCEGDYRATISYSGKDYKEPSINSDDQTYSGSITI